MGKERERGEVRGVGYGWREVGWVGYGKGGERGVRRGREVGWVGREVEGWVGHRWREE